MEWVPAVDRTLRLDGPVLKPTARQLHRDRCWRRQGAAGYIRLSGKSERPGSVAPDA